MKKKICFVVATPVTAKSFLQDHIRALSNFYDVTLVANFKEAPTLRESFEGVRILDAPIKRKISLLNDLKALLALMKIFHKEKFSSVHSVTPKAGLLAMLAASLTGVPNRFHTFTGQVWATKHGIYRIFLKLLDCLTFHTATTVLVDSPSQRFFLIHEGVVTAKRSGVLANGSITGVNTSRFTPSINSRESVRLTHGLRHDAFIFLFLGRLNAEKGITELVNAFKRSGCINNGGILMIIGPEEDDTLSNMKNELSTLGSSVIRVGFTNQPEYYMAAADVFCLPSHREGFGSVIIEAAACGVPSIASNIYGISDAIENGVTGILHPVKDEVSISNAMAELMGNPNRLSDLAKRGSKRASELFSTEILVKSMVNFYSSQLK